jgi:hypothetical protein
MSFVIGIACAVALVFIIVGGVEHFLTTLILPKTDQLIASLKRRFTRKGK